MSQADLQRASIRQVRWSIPADSEEIILDVPAVDVATSLTKRPLVCLSSRIKCFPRKESSPRNPRGAIAVRDLLNHTLFLDVVDHVLSESCFALSLEAGRSAPAISQEVARCLDVWFREAWSMAGTGPAVSEEVARRIDVWSREAWSLAGSAPAISEDVARRLDVWLSEAWSLAGNGPAVSEEVARRLDVLLREAWSIAGSGPAISEEVARRLDVLLREAWSMAGSGPAISELVMRRLDVLLREAWSMAGSAPAISDVVVRRLRGGALRKTAGYSNVFDTGIGATNSFPIGQLTGPKRLYEFGNAYQKPAALGSRLQSISSSRLSFHVPSGHGLRPQRDPVVAGVVVARRSHSSIEAWHRDGIASAATSLLRQNGSPIKFNNYSLPLAIRLPRHDGGARFCHSLDMLDSMFDGRCMTSRKGSRFFMGVSILDVRSKRDPLNVRNVDRAYCTKGVHRIRDLRMLASGRSNAVLRKCQPLAIKLCSAACSNNTAQQFFPRRRPRSTPHTGFLEGSVYTSVESFDFVRSSGNQTYQLPAALRDRAALSTFDQIALHVLANHMLESGQITDALLIGHSMGGQVLQSASPLLSTSCGSPRAAFFLDSRMQQPICLPPLPNVRLKRIEHSSMARFPQSMDSWLLQCVAHFRQEAPHVELAVPVIKYRTFLPFVDIVPRLALMSQDPSAAITADVDHHALAMECRLDVTLNIRPHMKY